MFMRGRGLADLGAYVYSTNTKRSLARPHSVPAPRSRPGTCVTQMQRAGANIRSADATQGGCPAGVAVTGCATRTGDLAGSGCFPIDRAGARGEWVPRLLHSLGWRSWAARDGIARSVAGRLALTALADALGTCAYIQVTLVHNIRPRFRRVLFTALCASWCDGHPNDGLIPSPNSSPRFPRTEPGAWLATLRPKPGRDRRRRSQRVRNRADLLVAPLDGSPSSFGIDSLDFRPSRLDSFARLNSSPARLTQQTNNGRRPSQVTPAPRGRERRTP
jgi:hypothetical protein